MKNTPEKISFVFFALGLLVFLVAASTLPFKDALLTSLYPKPASQAGSNTKNRPIETGFNVTGITRYGYTEALPYAPASHIEADLAEISNMGGRVIRVGASNRYISAEEAARRLDAFLTTAQKYNISVIIFFAGLIKDSTGLYPQNIENYYTDNWNGMLLLNHDFFAQGYKTTYLPYLQAVISFNKHHPNIYAWEIGNEFKDETSPSTLINFMADVSSQIKVFDPNHPVSSGMINAAHAGLTAQSLYASLPNLDIITIHAYNGDRAGRADVIWAVENRKKAIIEEIGFNTADDRSTLIRAEADYWKSLGASAFMQWGFIAQGLDDNGNGDKSFGMDTIWHTDYSNLFSTYQSLSGLKSKNHPNSPDNRNK